MHYMTVNKKNKRTAPETKAYCPGKLTPAGAQPQQLLSCRIEKKTREEVQRYKHVLSVNFRTMQGPGKVIAKAIILGRADVVIFNYLTPSVPVNRKTKGKKKGEV